MQSLENLAGNVSINDFGIKENRRIYASLTNGTFDDKELFSGYYSKIETEELYLLKKNMRNIALEKQIDYFEKLQLRLLESGDEYSLILALKIGQHIINVLYRYHLIALLRFSLQSFTFIGSSNQYSFNSGISSYSKTP